MRTLILLVFIPLLAKAAASFNLTVLHVNDIHMRLEETTKFSGYCAPEDKVRQGCYGGVARLAAAVNDIRAKEPNVVFLNAGDFFKGNAWYPIFKWKVVAHFANLLNFTAMSLGNHEFDDHVDGLLPLLKKASFPLIAANLDVSEESELEGLIPKSVVVEMENEINVGIIGYVTTDTPNISNSDNVKFLPEVEAVQEEAAKLKAQGVNILIALGHSGFEKDKMIAAKVANIDAVVGGHTNTFLYTGNAPSSEQPIGPYPTMVKNEATGKTVPVVQAYAYTKYLGVLKLQFDGEGELRSVGGSPLLLDSSVEQDKQILYELVPWQEDIRKLVNETVATSRVALPSWRGSESNLGNLVTDAIVDYYSRSTNTNTSWTYLSLAIVNSGSLRNGLKAGNISKFDVLNVLQSGDTIDVITISGKHLVHAFEKAVSGNWCPDKDGRMQSKQPLLQVSGFRMTVDPSGPPGNRITKLLARCSECLVPRYTPIRADKEYRVATSSFLTRGGDGYDMLKDGATSREKGPVDKDIFLSYITRISPITKGIEDRILVLQGGGCETSRAAVGPFYAPLLGLAIILKNST